MYTKEEIIEEIMHIRKEIGHDEVKPEIKEMYMDNNELTIITPDRPEKSIIIGKGGWVVGKLKEKIKVKSIHVISYTDIVLKKYQLELSVIHTKKIIEEKQIPQEYIKPFKNLYELLNKKSKSPHNKSIISQYIDENINREPYNESKCIIALSGGVDSSFSTLLAKALGFNIKPMTVDPGTIILPNQFKYNIKNLTEQINVEHEYLKTNMDNIIKDALNGKIHPCGRCSGHIDNVITEKCKNENINVMIFGDLLSTGSQSITKKDENIRINLPALFRMEKNEVKDIVSKYSVKKIKGYGCPLIVQVHKKYPQYRSFSIQRVLRETRAGILEPGEALSLIKTI